MDNNESLNPDRPQLRVVNIPKIEASYTICNKTSVSGNQSIVEYLFEQGKCGDICKDDGKCLQYITSSKLIFPV